MCYIRLAQINNLEKEVDRLKKELSTKDSSRERDIRNEGTANEVANLKSRCSSLQQDNERLSKLLREREKESSNGKNFSDGESRKGSVTTNVVLSRDGREDDLRRQLASLKQEVEEKSLLEKSIYCVEPQFRAGLSISATIILDSISITSGDSKSKDKDREKEKSIAHIHYMQAKFDYILCLDIVTYGRYPNFNHNGHGNSGEKSSFG